MFDLRIRIFCIMFIYFLVTTTMTGTMANDKDNALDLEMILAGIKHFDNLVHSGTGNSTLILHDQDINSVKKSLKLKKSLNMNLFLNQNSYGWSLMRISHQKKCPFRKQQLLPPQWGSGKWYISKLTNPDTHLAQTLNCQYCMNGRIRGDGLGLVVMRIYLHT